MKTAVRRPSAWFNVRFETLRDSYNRQFSTQTVACNLAFQHVKHSNVDMSATVADERGVTVNVYHRKGQMVWQEFAA